MKIYKLNEESSDNNWKYKSEPTDFNKKVAELTLNKNGNALKGYLHLDNKKARAMFTEITGIKLPNTVKGTMEVLSSFHDESMNPVDHEKVAKDSLEKEIKTVKSTLSWNEHKLKYKYMTDKSSLLDYVKTEMLDKGFNTVKKVNTSYFLVDDAGRGYNLSSKALKGYGVVIREYVNALNKLKELEKTA
jgi:hypothetical protein